MKQLKKYIDNYNKLREKFCFNKKYLTTIGFSEEEISFLRKENILTDLINEYFTIHNEDLNYGILYHCYLITSIFPESYITNETAIMLHGLGNTTSSVEFSGFEEKTIKIKGYSYYQINVITKGQTTNYEFEINNGDIQSNLSKKAFKIATKEQTLIDYFLQQKEVFHIEDFWDLELSKMSCKKKINIEELLKISKKYNNNILNKNIENFCKWLAL